jgi:hypothetical protein
MPITNRIRKSTEVQAAGAHSAGIWVDTVSGALKFNPNGSVHTVGGDVGKGVNIFLDPLNGSDHNSGFGPHDAKATLDGTQGAFSVATAGQGDVIYILSDGSTTATVRVDAAFTWNKKNTHLVGISSGSRFSGRARIAPNGATTAFANFFTVSVDGCRFENVQWFHGFNTGVAAAICMTVTGNRNVFVNCHIAGMGDAVSAQSATSRSLKISTGGENDFIDCVIGLDTVTRTAVANASVEFAAATPRNTFKGCVFPIYTSSAVPVIIKGAASGCMDRFQLFERCLFINGAGSGSTTLTGTVLLAASAGGILFLKDCDNVACGPWGSSDATTKAQIYVSGPITTNTTGIALTAVN